MRVSTRRKVYNTTHEIMSNIQIVCTHTWEDRLSSAFFPQAGEQTLLYHHSGVQILEIQQELDSCVYVCVSVRVHVCGVTCIKTYTLAPTQLLKCSCKVELRRQMEFEYVAGLRRRTEQPSYIKPTTQLLMKYYSILILYL